MVAAAVAAHASTFPILISTAVLLLLCSHSPAATNTLTPGGPAVDSNSSLVSLNGLFTLGFPRVFSDNYPVIWYQNDTSKFLWIANRELPSRGGSGALSLDENGTLQITFSAGGDPVVLFSSRRRSSVVAVLEDTGNFVVREDGEDSGELLWQSFDYPTDSWLPGMKLGVVSGGRSRKLTSWLSERVPSEGAFTLEWFPAREELVVKRRGVEFWTSGKQLSPNEFQNLDLRPFSLDFNITRTRVNNEEDYLNLAVAVNERSYRYERNFTIWRLGADGGIGDKSSGESVLSYNLCDGNTTENGCLRWAGPECRRRNGYWYEVIGGSLSNSSIIRVDNNASLGVGDCAEMCWRDCECAAARFAGSNGNDTGCVFVYGELGSSGAKYRYGRIVREAAGEASSSAAADPSSKAAGADRKKWVGGSVAAAGALLLMVAGAIYLLGYRRRRRLREKRLLAELRDSDEPSDIDGEMESDDGDPGHQLKVYSVASIVAATDSFSMQNKLGQGGFGPVYKGELADGREIAVKRLSKRSGQGLVEFKNELVLIAKLQHRNLVRLLGCCIHEEEKMLVYEYMPNKSLDFFIFDESKRSLLDWNKRFDIIEGIAQGLLYLHKYSRVRIVHRDLKAGNILLDENLNPKISDFGMARIFRTNASEANTNRIVGTYGYMSPEYAMDGTYSIKSDIFSYGILLLEIVSGRKNHGLIQLEPPINLVGYAWKLWKEGTPLDLMDPTLKDSYACHDQILRCINVGLLCIEYNAFDRPDMSEVLSMLTSETVQLPTPERPAFTMMRRSGCPISEESSSPINPPKVCSANGVTITMISAR